MTGSDALAAREQRREVPLLVADAIVAGYVPEVNILNGCSMELFHQEMVGIIGPNGAGKSDRVR